MAGQIAFTVQEVGKGSTILVETPREVFDFILVDRVRLMGGQEISGRRPGSRLYSVISPKWELKF